MFGRKTGAIHAVVDASFDLRHDETLALVGESGRGKSTTGRAVTRLIEPGGGSVRLNGADFLALSQSALRRERASIEMVFQDPFASLKPFGRADTVSPDEVERPRASLRVPAEISDWQKHVPARM